MPKIRNEWPGLLPEPHRKRLTSGAAQTIYAFSSEPGADAEGIEIVFAGGHIVGL